MLVETADRRNPGMNCSDDGRVLRHRHRQSDAACITNARRSTAKRSTLHQTGSRSPRTLEANISKVDLRRRLHENDAEASTHPHSRHATTLTGDAASSEILLGTPEVLVTLH
jgi:hypothetical protein